MYKNNKIAKYFWTINNEEARIMALYELFNSRIIEISDDITGGF